MTGRRLAAARRAEFKKWVLTSFLTASKIAPTATEKRGH
jgi:hypothetical protein